MAIMAALTDKSNSYKNIFLFSVSPYIIPVSQQHRWYFRKQLYLDALPLLVNTIPPTRLTALVHKIHRRSVRTTQINLLISNIPSVLSQNTN